MFEHMPSFTKAQMDKLHDATLHVLREVGVVFHDREALEIFRRHGFRVDGRTVFFEEGQVRKALETAPARFEIAGRDPGRTVVLGGTGLAIAPGYGSPFLADARGNCRPGTLEDYATFCRLIQTSGHVDINGMSMVHPSDVPPETAHVDMLLANMTLCDKPFLGSSTSRQAALDSLAMAEILWGGGEGLNRQPTLMAIISSLSPLQYSEEMAGALVQYARRGQPVMIGLLMMAGSTGPVTLAQRVRAGTPVVYGGTSTITDMLRGALAVDAQAEVESALALATTILSGSHFILHGCGILSSYNAMSFEKFILDEEICGMLRRMLRPTEVSDAAIDLAAIREVGPGGEFLSHPSTLQRCRSEFFIPSLMERSDYGTWKAGGRRRTEERAAEKLRERLDAYEKPGISRGIERDLERYAARRKSG